MAIGVTSNHCNNLVEGSNARLMTSPSAPADLRRAVAWRALGEAPEVMRDGSELAMKSHHESFRVRHAPTSSIPRTPRPDRIQPSRNDRSS
jgi:hypothetical protein